MLQVQDQSMIGINTLLPTLKIVGSFYKSMEPCLNIPSKLRTSGLDLFKLEAVSNDIKVK